MADEPEDVVTGEAAEVIDRIAALQAALVVRDYMLLSAAAAMRGYDEHDFLVWFADSIEKRLREERIAAI